MRKPIHRSLLLFLFFVLAVSGCGGSDSDSGGEQTPTSSAKIVILNQMTTSGRVIDGVDMDFVQGSNSVGATGVKFSFPKPVPFGESGTVYLSQDQCDIYWDLSPKSLDVISIDNSGVSTFVPCGATLSCKSVLLQGLGVFWGDLQGGCR